MSSYVLCIDPGASGAWSLTKHDGCILTTCRVTGDSSIVLAADRLESLATFPHSTRALIEQVWASPVMSRSAAFAFGRNYGFWIGALKARGIPVFGITPQKWQKVAVPGLTATGPARKLALRNEAKRLFPGQRVTAATADALLMTIYAKARLDAGAELGERL